MLGSNVVTMLLDTEEMRRGQLGPDQPGGSQDTRIHFHQSCIFDFQLDILQ